jgi:hypothetical protein
VEGNQTMRRKPLLFLLFLLVLALSLPLTAFRLDARKDGQSFPDTSIQARHTPDKGHARHNSVVTPTPPINCSQQQLIQLLLKPGALEIWSTGSTYVPTNSRFNPLLYPLTIANGKPLFTGADLDPNGLSTGRNQWTGYYFINFSMKGAAALKLTSFTSHNLGTYITITLERVVISSLILHYTLPGKGQFQVSPHSLAISSLKC